jgi:hypothetical protein
VNGPARDQALRAGAAEQPSVLPYLEPPWRAEVGGAEREPAERRRGRRGSGGDRVRRDPQQRRFGLDGHPGGGRAAPPGQVRRDLPGGVPSGQGGDVGGLRGVHEVPGGEHAVGRGGERRVDSGSPGPRIDGQPRGPREAMVGDPVSGENKGFAPDEASAPVACPGELHSAQPAVGAGNPPDDGRRPDRDTPAHRGGCPERGVALLPLVLGDQRDDASARVGERHRRGEADVLRADDERLPGQLFAAEVHPLLQFTRGHDPGGPVAGDQPGGPRALPAAGGQQHGRGLDGLDSPRAGDRRCCPRQLRDGRPGPDLGARAGGGAGEGPRVPGPGQHAAQVTEPVPGVPAVPRHAARLRLPVRDEDALDAEPPELDGGRQPRRAGAHDENVSVHGTQAGQ